LNRRSDAVAFDRCGTFAGFKLVSDIAIAAAHMLNALRAWFRSSNTDARPATSRD
jgi:hypothetical protein